MIMRPVLKYFSHGSKLLMAYMIWIVDTWVYTFSLKVKQDYLKEKRAYQTISTTAVHFVSTVSLLEKKTYILLQKYIMRQQPQQFSEATATLHRGSTTVVSGINQTI